MGRQILRIKLTIHKYKITEMTTQEYVKQVAIEFAFFNLKIMDTGNLDGRSVWEQFIESKSYLSIPQPDDWISVTERLPEPVQISESLWIIQALLCSTDGMNPSEIIAYGGSKNGCIDNFKDRYIGTIGYTHWQPLPKPKTK